MRKIGNFARTGALSLASLLDSCETPEKFSRVGLETKNVVKNTESKRITVELVPFSEYNPSVDLEPVCVKPEIVKYLERGLNADLNFERYKINNYFDFKNNIYQIAREMGYDSDDIKKMFPRETIKLICKIIARKINYFGVTQDYDSKFRRKEELRRVRETLSSLLNDSKTPENYKSDAKLKIEQLTELEKKWEEIQIYERKLSDSPGYMTISADDFSIDELFGGGIPVVCRHYTTIANGIFFVLKNDNPRLINTWVSGYSDKNHRWNQVITATREEKGVKYTFSFFDSTWFDLSSEIEGYDSSHFPDVKILNAQIEKLPGGKIIRPFKN